MTAAALWRQPTWLAQQIRIGERLAVAKAISLIENTLPENKRRAAELLTLLLAHHRSSPPSSTIRVGISGPPGVGKVCRTFPHAPMVAPLFFFSSVLLSV
jgi:putative protein kinase ArgK-like GTPase of G3E family